MKLSIIVPCYNVAGRIEKSVNSILKQNLTDFEIILVNDGSKDDTFIICERLASEYKEVKVFNQKNGGVAIARNTGLENVSGEYITFVDSDDYLADNIYSIMLNKMENENADIGIFNASRIYSDKEKRLDSINKIVENSDSMLEILFKYNGAEFYLWNKIYKKSVLLELDFEENIKYEDIMFNFRACNQANKMIVIDKIGYYYVDNPYSIVNEEFKYDQYDNIIQRKKLLKGINELNPTLSNLAIDKLIDGYLSTGFKISQSSPKNKKEYLKKIRLDIRNDYQEIIFNNKTSIQKKIAINLLLFNSNLFNKLYKLYLNK
ncbi:glycosyltransferase family 2 protein [Marinilactibacillus psychrotolerans]|uniref:glycosyltransferase family 2 protein n=1 Tax=Marinilactibacillus psychrotolerans TaxID=191770 RepID=UPI003885F173